MNDIATFLSNATFPSVVAVPTMLHIEEKIFFGRRFVKMGPLLTIGGALLFRQEGALGHGLRGHPAILGTLLGADPTDATGYVERLRSVARRRLTHAGGDRNSFAELYLGPELRKLGIEWHDLYSSKALKKKIGLSDAFLAMDSAFREGAALGFHFPNAIEVCYDAQPDSSEDLSLAKAIADLVEQALIWIEAQPANLFSRRDLSELRRLQNQPVEVTDIPRIDADTHTPGQRLRRSPNRRRTRRRDRRGR